MRQVFGWIALFAGAFMLCISVFASKGFLSRVHDQQNEARRYGVGGPPHPTHNSRLNSLISSLVLVFIGLWLLGLLDRIL